MGCKKRRTQKKTRPMMMTRPKMMVIHIFMIAFFIEILLFQIFVVPINFGFVNFYETKKEVSTKIPIVMVICYISSFVVVVVAVRFVAKDMGERIIVIITNYIHPYMVISHRYLQSMLIKVQMTTIQINYIVM